MNEEFLNDDMLNDIMGITQEASKICVMCIDYVIEQYMKTGEDILNLGENRGLLSVAREIYAGGTEVLANNPEEYRNDIAQMMETTMRIMIDEEEEP